ncbi:hypothetical protein [Legionella sp. km772]|uniref:hypothetical protein n=1 Tax=Legionella sp. km772 TaxID=2498111 RepID=UPI000F8C58DF|nr:hypothetical protein [Legionella sp. km772]RUR10428.1 hypothetical protein ELY15_08130 [Legionella sp. km772]
MVYSSQNAAFRRDKHQFFSQMSAFKDPRHALPAIEARVQAIDYSFLLKNQQALETEFTQMFQLLQKDPAHQEQFWLYCYYCASLLEQFHRAYNQPGKEAHYQGLKVQIKKRISKEVAADTKEEEGFIHSLYQSYLASYRNLTSSPYHLSQIRDYVAYANLCRIYWVFTRLTLTQGLTAARDLQLIDKLDAILGTHTDVDKIISTIQAPTGIINYFSVGFFLARFMIDAGLLIKHTFFPSDLEKGAENGCEVTKMAHLPGAVSIEAYRTSYILVDDSLYYVPKQGKALKLSGDLSALQKLLGDKTSLRLTAEQIKTTITQPTTHKPEATTRFERFKHELYKRHCNFANDLVWATVNFLTNFNHISGIPGPIAGYLTAVFLAFDVGIALYKCKLAKEEYFTKKAQYLEEIAQYSDPSQCKGMSKAQRLAHLQMLNKQMRELEFEWKTKEATFHFVAAAAAILMAGFTASMLISTPLLIAATYFVCTVAVAMYFSAGAYANYKDKSLRLEQAQLTGTHLVHALKEYETARNDYVFTLAKNTIAPLLLITSYAICWPAALVLTAAYLGYELLHAHDQHHAHKEAKKLALEAPAPEREAEYMSYSPI